MTRRWFILTLLLVATAIPRQTYADDNLQLAAQQIKAGLLYNFLKYTQWPPAAMAKSSSMVVCIFGDDPFGGDLQAMAGRTVNQREIAVRSVHDVNNTPDCNLLFINADEKVRWPKLRDFLKDKPVLTVSDFEDFATSGGMIEFGLKDNHINVDLNTDAVMAARLQVQDRLLRLVTVVHPASKEGGK